MTTQPSRSERIAALNDTFRQSFQGGKVMITAGINDLLPEQIILIGEAVKQFDAFTEDNDPYGEHDFGVIDMKGIGKIFWKIDYYAPDMMHGSEDPTNTEQTVRVLTIMFSHEY